MSYAWAPLHITWLGSTCWYSHLTERKLRPKERVVNEGKAGQLKANETGGSNFGFWSFFFFFSLRSLSRTKGLIRWMGATWCPCGVTLRLTSLLCVVGLPSLFSYCGTGYTGRGHRGFPARRSRFSSAADWMTCGRLLLLLWTLTLKWKWHLSELWETLGKCFVNGITRDKEKKHYLQ